MLWKLALITALALVPDVSGKDSLEEPSLDAKELEEPSSEKKDNTTESKKFVLTDEHRKQIINLVTAVCTKSNQADKVLKVNDVILKFINCSQGLFNPFAIYDEVVATRENGSHAGVIKKHCKLSEKLKGCIHVMTVGIYPCVPTDLKQYFVRVNNATDSLIDYVCEQEGKKIADFVTENGAECFAEKSEPVMGCAKSLASRRTPKDAPISMMCKMYDQLTKCVVTVIKDCPGLAPSVMAESLLVHMRATVTDCPEIKKEEKENRTIKPEMKDQDDLDSEERNKAKTSTSTPLRTGEL